MPTRISNKNEADKIVAQYIANRLLDPIRINSKGSEYTPNNNSINLINSFRFHPSRKHLQEVGIYNINNNALQRYYGLFNLNSIESLILNGIMQSNNKYTNREFSFFFNSIKNDYQIIERLNEARNLLEIKKKRGNKLVSQKLLNSLSNIIKRLIPYWMFLKRPNLIKKFIPNLSPASSSYHPLSPSSSYDPSPNYSPIRNQSPVSRPPLPRPRPPLPRPRPPLPRPRSRPPLPRPRSRR